MTRARFRLRFRPASLASVAVLVTGAAMFGLSGSSAADVSAVNGSAYGFFLSVSLFGGPANLRGPSPTVTLPAGGSASPLTATVASGAAVVGPATFFSSGQMDVSAQGTLGPTGSVTTTANIANITTSSGGAFAATTTPVPVNPAPNSAPIAGHIQVNASQDNFTYQFNEQITNPDGSLTVYAAHQRLIGPTAVGDLFIGKSECGLTGAPAPPTTTTLAPTTTTLPPTTTTLPRTTTTLPPTTTTLPGSTTTTVPGDCTPGQGDDKPGNGYGDRNHSHCGPPGQTGTQHIVSTRDARPSWPAPVGLGLMFLLSLVVSFRRSRRSGHRG